ncbi:MAG: hypothetical protein COA84_14010 [Robiginitomaculum sp.]|nr:MAG: hypothetical protein COA84_14010 [Robiginitomaculum sp.]
MEKFTIKDTSWHYRWIKWVYFLSPAHRLDSRWDTETFKTRLPTDFCSYWRRFTMASSIAAFYAACATFSASVVALVIGGIIYSIFTDPSGAAIVAGIIIGIIAFIIAIFGGVKGYDKVDAYLTVTDPGIVRTKYRAWKGKYCPVIEYKRGS